MKKKEELSHWDKVSYLRVGLAMSGISVSDMHSDLIISIMECIEKHKDNCDIRHIIDTRLEVEERHTHIREGQISSIEEGYAALVGELRELKKVIQKRTKDQQK